MGKAVSAAVDPIGHPLRPSQQRCPRIGFLGLGWIGRDRLRALADSGMAEIAAVADTAPDARTESSRIAPGCRLLDSMDALLEEDLDGVVIATPSAQHADQAVRALERGAAVFCQKPLARDRTEAGRVVRAAEGADRLLGVDFSYRHVRGMRELRKAIADGELGEIFAADLVFHNAYGPDKPWFHDLALSGGGCVMDLGSHLVDLCLWMLGAPVVTGISSRLYTTGKPLDREACVVEDYACADMTFANGAGARIACSWYLHAGRDCVIEAAFHGTRGGAALRNIDGSFYDFTLHRFHGTAAEQVASYPDPWGGRALVEWARQLAAGGGFDPQAWHLLRVAEVLDGIYRR